MNSDDALARVEAGTVPTEWQVFYAKKDFFVEQAWIFLLLTIGLIAFFVWYTFNPSVIVSIWFVLNLLPGPMGSFIANSFGEVLRLDDRGLWRLIDYGVGTLLGIFLVLISVDGFEKAGKPRGQFVLLHPEGVILKGDEKKATVVEYNTLSDVFISEDKGDKVKLSFMSREDEGERVFKLDKRFGNVRKLARDVIRAYEAQQSVLR